MFRNAIRKDDHETGLRYYACDFETTTASIYEKKTEVWSFAVDEVGKFEPEIFGSIQDFFTFCGDVERGWKKRLYFHNLKFDGEFILYEALTNQGFATALDGPHMRKPREILEKEIVYAISDVGQWYFIAFVLNGCRIEIRDSLKLLPLTLEQIGKNICSRYRKSSMDYDNKKSLEDCSAEDLEYIKNDVLVLSEALDKILILHDEQTPFGAVHSLTIGGACWARYKNTMYGEMKNICIKLDQQELPEESGSKNFDDYIRKGYRGGYCYVNKRIEGKLLNQKGFTADVNSLYPFVMCHEYSGFVYPYGKGKYCKGKVPDKFLSESYYFYARIKVAFRVKPGYVPTVQKKHSFHFLSNLYLESSQIYDSGSGQYVGDYTDVELTLAKDDYILFFRHYNIVRCEYLDYIVFTTASGICDDYIKTMAKIKVDATKEGNKGVRTIAKLFSNNLYGQFAKGDNSSFKVCGILPGEPAEYGIIEEHEKKINNIAIGAAVTAHARFYQITTIQNNFDRFCYSDTDSLHCVGDPADFIGKIDSSEYGAYDIENTWTKARFVRQKTYIEENEKDGRWTICAAGMTPKQKEIFQRDFQFDDFKIGLHISGGKLLPDRVPGGVILKEVDFTLK